MTTAPRNVSCARAMLVTWLVTLAAMAATAEAARVSLRQELGDPPEPGTTDAGTVVGRGGASTGMLPFYLAVEYACSSPDVRRLVLITIADTVQLTDVTSQPTPQRMQVDVPLRQLAWLAPAKACRELPAAQAPAAGDTVRYFRLRSRATAFATLTCSGTTGPPDVAITTVPLDVWLGCDPPEPDDASAEESAESLTSPEPDSGEEK